jgi:hypothetical protein
VTAYNMAALESRPSNEVSYKMAPLGAHSLTVNNGSGSGEYAESTRVKVSAKAPAAGQKFDRWTGDCAKAAKRGIGHIQSHAPQVHVPVLKIIPGTGLLPRYHWKARLHLPRRGRSVF